MRAQSAVPAIVKVFISNSAIGTLTIGGDDTEDETPRPQYRGVQYHALCEAALATERQDDDAAPSGAAPRAELGGVTAAHAGARFGVPDETEHDEDDEDEDLASVSWRSCAPHVARSRPLELPPLDGPSLGAHFSPTADGAGISANNLLSLAVLIALSFAMSTSSLLLGIKPSAELTRCQAATSLLVTSTTCASCSSLLKATIPLRAFCSCIRLKLSKLNSPYLDAPPQF